VSTGRGSCLRADRQTSQTATSYSSTDTTVAP
jgi:hypothetical protein